MILRGRTGSGGFNDVTVDGTVDVTDILIVIANWGATTGGSTNVNQNGSVDVTDLLIFIALGAPALRSDPRGLRMARPLGILPSETERLLTLVLTVI